MDQGVAERVVAHLHAASAELHEAIQALHDGGEAASRPEVKRRIAHLISALFVGLLQPLYAEHPDLAYPTTKDIPPLPPELVRAIFGEGE